jgi:hypothetical protein
MTRHEYPRSERDHSPWPVPGAGPVPQGLHAVCGLPPAEDWHRLVGLRCLADGVRFPDANEAAKHLARKQFTTYRNAR